MNNLSASLKKFMGNKNTVTILGIALCIVILIIGYNRTINSKIKLTQVPYALQTIQPKTEITSEMIGTMRVPEAFIKVGSYYKSADQILGKYSAYNSVIAQGSLFYKDLLTDEKYLPDSYRYDVPSGSTVINYPVNMSTTYANSIMPTNYINIYFKATLEDEEDDSEDNKYIMFGKFLTDIEVLAVKDSQGQHVFENTEEVRVPAYMLFAIKEDQHLLLRKALYLADEYDIELLIVPNTEEISEDADVKLSSTDIKEFIESKTIMVELDQLPTVEDAINEQNKEQEEQTEE